MRVVTSSLVFAPTSRELTLVEASPSGPLPIIRRGALFSSGRPKPVTLAFGSSSPARWSQTSAGWPGPSQSRAAVAQDLGGRNESALLRSPGDGPMAQIGQAMVPNMRNAILYGVRHSIFHNYCSCAQKYAQNFSLSALASLGSYIPIMAVLASHKWQLARTVNDDFGPVRHFCA
jgi:hypothetical protein